MKSTTKKMGRIIKTTPQILTHEIAAPKVRRTTSSQSGDSQGLTYTVPGFDFDGAQSARCRALKRGRIEDHFTRPGAEIHRFGLNWDFRFDSPLPSHPVERTASLGKVLARF
jgi:hypothetical protein